MKRRELFLCLIALFSLILKIYIILKIRGMKLLGDEIEYLHKAISVSQGLNLKETFRPPGYIYSLALFIKFFGKRIAGIYILQSIVSTATIPLIYSIGKELFTPSIGIVGSLLFAFYPDFIGYTHYLLNETFFIFYLYCAFYFIFKYSIPISILNWNYSFKIISLSN